MAKKIAKTDNARLPKHYHDEPLCIRCEYIEECGSLNIEHCDKRKVVR